ncbi:hypothetical protein T265_04410 [Opisthorchis viverrini]|uniref:Uncharacterized protein n=1 Tax=Opisthorchis viverrini TaxID=6198 RepID=A0A074ZP27_OPIVI|nr:hypothetical protein T265_04410 [Opisthorchis viverrini]KER28871.1 hypothetical protein T265_04410 [Opisthorchis viverrini]
MCWLLSTMYTTNHFEDPTGNVAFKKRPAAEGRWMEQLTTGDPLRLFAPDPTKFFHYYMGLGGVYNLISTKLCIQDIWSFGKQRYPLDVLAKGLMFKREGEAITLYPTKPVQLMIIDREIPNLPAPVSPILISEVGAHGTLLREAFVTSLPPEESIPENYYVETKMAITGKQKLLFVQPIWREWRHRDHHKDVLLGIVQNRTVIDQLPTNTKYDGWRRSLRQWLANGQRPFADFVRIGSPYTKGDIILMKRTDTFDVEKVYSQLVLGENSAVVGFIHGNGDDNLTQLLARLETEYAGNAIWTHEQDIDLRIMIRTIGARGNPTHRKAVRFIHATQCHLPYLSLSKNPHTDTVAYNCNVILLHQLGENRTTIDGLYYSSLDVAPGMRPSSITAGVNETFYVHTYGEYVAPCYFRQRHPWDVLAKGLMSKRKGEVITMHPTKPAQLIIIGRENPNQPAPFALILMSEVEAFGTLLREVFVTSMSPEGPIPENYYMETKMAITGKQKLLFVQPIWREWRHRDHHKDVLLGIVQNRTVIDQLPTNTKYDGWRRSLRQWLANGQRPFADFVRIGSPYTKGDIILMKRTDTFDVEKVYSQLVLGENSAVVGFIHGNGDDNLTQLLARLETEYAGNAIWTHEQDIDLRIMIRTIGARGNPTHRKAVRFIHATQCHLPYLSLSKNPHIDTVAYNCNVILLHQLGENRTTIDGLYYSSLDVAPGMRPSSITVSIRAPDSLTQPSRPSRDRVLHGQYLKPEISHVMTNMFVLTAKRLELNTTPAYCHHCKTAQCASLNVRSA